MKHTFEDGYYISVDTKDETTQLTTIRVGHVDDKEDSYQLNLTSDELKTLVAVLRSQV